MKQLIIARKDLNMSPGKLAAQVSHASMAFLTNMIKENSVRRSLNEYRVYGLSGDPIEYRHDSLRALRDKAIQEGRSYFYAEHAIPGNMFSPMVEVEEKAYYKTELIFATPLYENWINGSFTKIVCEAKNKSQMEKAIKLAEELDLREGRDFFLIRDNCLTELEPEDDDGRTLTCIGFKPMPNDIVGKISKKFQLYR